MTIISDSIVTDVGVFTPRVFPYIHIDLNTLRKLPYWRRQLVAIWIHEFIHLLQFVFVYRCNTDKWSKITCSELPAMLVQDFFFWLTVPSFRCVPFQRYFMDKWNAERTAREKNPPTDFKKGLRRNGKV